MPILKRKVNTQDGWLYKESTAAFLFTLPFIIGILFFIAVPLLASLYYSFCNYNILKPAEWIGLKNYFDIFHDETFYQALKVTIKYALISVPLKLLFALIVALILIRDTKLTPFYRASYYLPSIIGASVAVSILWRRMFAVDGLVNNTLGIEFAWLGNISTAIWVIIGLSVWQFGSSMLIFLSAMKQIPASLYESAKVDGAGNIYSFFYITLPLLTPTIFFNLIMQSINGLMVFSQGQIITDGKPMNSTLFYVLYMYKQSFEYGKLGYASALGWIFIAMVVLFTVVLFKTKKYWVYE